jgi:hypothetical protein
MSTVDMKKKVMKKKVMKKNLEMSILFNHNNNNKNN